MVTIGLGHVYTWAIARFAVLDCFFSFFLRENYTAGSLQNHSIRGYTAKGRQQRYCILRDELLFRNSWRKRAIVHEGKSYKVTFSVMCRLCILHEVIKPLPFGRLLPSPLAARKREMTRALYHATFNPPGSGRLDVR